MLELENHYHLGTRSMKNTMLKLLPLTLAVSVSSQAFAVEEGRLLIWMGADKAFSGIAEVGKRFTDDTGIVVEVVTPESPTDRFQQAAATGSGPDIIFWAHDRFGEWAQSGLLQEIQPSRAAINALDEGAWAGVQFDGKTWGYPVSLEAVGLIYNRDLLPEPPSSFEEIFDISKAMRAQDKRAIMWDYNNTYFTWPMLAAAGGYIFAQNEDGSFDLTDSGVNNEGALKGASLLRRMIDEDVMPRGVDYGVMEAAFSRGESAMMINGPWAWENARASGINFGVAALPTVNGQPSQAMVGIWAAGFNASSPNYDLAVEFMENYVLTMEGLATLNADTSLGAVAHKEFMVSISDDPLIAQTFENAQIGEPMLNIPAMGRFWAAMEPALQNLTSGRQSPEDALNAARTRILAE